MCALLRPWLRRRAKGRIPEWARYRKSTSDLVQDVLGRTFLRPFEPKYRGAVNSYLLRAIENGRLDEMRRARHRPFRVPLGKAEPVAHSGASPLQRMEALEAKARVREGLARLSPRDERLIRGRFWHEYTFEQLAGAVGLQSADAARMALNRALTRLSRVMPDE